jgi:O-antigen ligase
MLLGGAGLVINALWYLTIILSIWGSSLGGITLPGLGLLYPFRIVLPLLALLLLIKTKKNDWTILKKTWLTILPLALFMLLHGMLSLIWTSNQMNTLKAIINLFYVALFIVVFFLMINNDRKMFNNTLLVLAINFSFILVLAVIECFFGVYLFSEAAKASYVPLLNNFGLHYPSVCFDNTNNLAFNLTLTMPFMIYAVDAILPIKTWKKRLIIAIIFLVTAFIMFNTSSRLGYISYPIIVLGYALVKIRKQAISIISFSMIILILIVVELAAFQKLGQSISDMPNNLNQQNENSDKDINTEDITNLVVDDHSVQVRMNMVIKALRVTRDTYGLGIGTKNSINQLRKYSDLPRTRITDYHMFYAELLAEYGVIPFLYFIVFQFMALFRAIWLFLHSDKHKELAFCCIAGIIGFVFASAYCSSSMFLYIMWIQFALWSFVINEYSKVKKESVLHSVSVQ